MPPKKAAKGKAKKKKTDGGKKSKDEKVAVNEVEDAAKQVLSRQADDIRKQTIKEDHDFNDFQQQREKLNYFWIVEKKKLEDKKAELRNKERELQDLEEKHQVEIKIYKQRVKHLLFEHQNELTQRKTQVEVALKLSQDDNRAAEGEVKLDRRALKQGLKESELSHSDYLKSLKHQQDRNTSYLRAEFERKTSEVHKNFERRMKVVREQLEARRKAETAAIEEQKNAHIDSLMKAHEKAFAEIKNYYNDITHNNLDLIKSLKEEVADMRKREQADEKKMYEIAQENRRMSEPLRKARQDVDRLRAELERYMIEKQELQNTKARLLVIEEQLRNFKWEHEVLSQRFDISRCERDELYARFQNTICEIQQKSGFKNLLLERKLDGLEEEVEKREVYLNELLSRTNLDPSIVEQVKGKVDNILEQKSKMVADLQAEIARISTSHVQLYRAVCLKLREFGVPQEELGFQPALPRQIQV